MKQVMSVRKTAYTELPEFLPETSRFEKYYKKSPEPVKFGAFLIHRVSKKLT